VPVLTPAIMSTALSAVIPTQVGIQAQDAPQEWSVDVHHRAVPA
jgi:hypothetical protein